LVIVCWDPTFFRASLMDRTTHILRTTLPDYLEDMPLASRRQLYFMHDSPSARKHLNAHYPGRWIGRGGPIAWPPCSPDLNLLDFYLWGHLKSVMYSTAVADVPTLRAHIAATCQTVRTTPGILSDCTNVTKRSDNSVIIHFRTHVVIHFFSSLYMRSLIPKFCR
jgi:hypothetical protein